MHDCVAELQQPPLHTLPLQQGSPRLPQAAVMPLLLPDDVPLLLPDTVLLHALSEVPETDAVCPLYVQVIVQLEPLPPTEHEAPLADSLPHRQRVSPFSVALQHAGALPPPEEQPTTSAIPDATTAKHKPHPRMSSAYQS
jgi:hypothetical protein